MFWNFNQPFIPNEKLKSVKFGKSFNKYFIPNEKLKNVKFGKCFNKYFIPNEKLKIIISSNYTYQIEFSKKLYRKY
jgi:hypothetical protein